MKREGRTLPTIQILPEESFGPVAIYLAVLALLLALNVFVGLRSRKSPLQDYFLAAGLSLALWIVTIILRAGVPGQPWLWVMICMQYLAICSMSLNLLFLGISCQSGHKLPSRVIVPLSLPAALVYLLVLTNPLHQGCFRGFTAFTETTAPAYGIVAGYNYIYLALGLLFCCLSLIRQADRRRPAIVLFLAGILTPVIVHIFIVAGAWRPPFMLEPLLSAVSITLIGLSVLRFHFVDITPLARRMIMNEISSALAITRLDGRIIDYNLALSRLFEPAVTVHRLMPVADLSPLLRVFPTEPKPLRREIQLDTAAGQHLFEWTVHEVCDRNGRPVGFVYRLAELENELQLRRLLAGQNEQLASANQSLQRYAQIASELRQITVRNQLAREMHDSLGHSLIILIALLERIQSRPDTEPEQTELFGQAGQLLHQILNQLPLTQNLPPYPAYEDHLPAPAAENEVAAAALPVQLRALGNELALSGVSLEMDCRGPVEQIPAAHESEILQISREAMTNAVKHGHATLISLFLLADDRHYDLILLDNGCGNPNFVKGFGLLNMERRVQTLGGTLRLQSDSSGFGVYVAVPWPRKTDGPADPPPVPAVEPLPDTGTDSCSGQVVL
ncbi:MAG: histidine kinase N-terminal 7TM domain-containing protein [Clostridiaceae bacterium]|nr:histidine kinase N-terminal 7TM domain-containing protein [Clostridiaceae bacterium]